MNRNAEIIADVLSELKIATAKYKSFNSPHEGLSVLQEEVEELKAEVYNRRSFFNPHTAYAEAVQVAAMAIRFAQDCCDG